MAAIHPAPSAPGEGAPAEPSGEESRTRTTTATSVTSVESVESEQSPLVRVQAQMRGALARKRWKKVRLVQEGSTVWRSTHEESKVWVVRPKLILDLLQHDHFQKAGIFWLLLYILFIFCLVAAGVNGQQGNLYYELEMGLEQRLGQAGGGIATVSSAAQVWSFMDGFITILHEDEDLTVDTSGQPPVTDWGDWEQFKVDPPAAGAVAEEVAEVGAHRDRLVTLQNRVIGSGVLIAQRRRQLAPPCERYGADLDDGAAASSATAQPRCLLDGEDDTAGFRGKESGAQYNWNPQCNCYPAGVFCAAGAGTTLAQDRQRLGQLQRDGWLDPQTSEVTATVLLLNPTREQIGLVTARFTFSDSGWVTGELVAETTPIWRPYSQSALWTLMTVSANNAKREEDASSFCTKSPPAFCSTRLRKNVKGSNRRISCNRRCFSGSSMSVGRLIMSAK